MRTIFYDQDEAQKVIIGEGEKTAIAVHKALRQKSYIRISAYFFLFIAGILAGMAIAGLLS